jgi:hypothetical protein
MALANECNGCLARGPDRASNVVDNKADLFQMA